MAGVDRGAGEWGVPNETKLRRSLTLRKHSAGGVFWQQPEIQNGVQRHPAPATKKFCA